jgi:hypothetical protein
MFSPNDILTLSKAGFTAQQIAGLSMIANQPATPVPANPVVPAPATPVVQAPAPVVQAPAPGVQAPAPVVQAPAPGVQAPATNNISDSILAELQKLTGLVQSNNIAGSNMPTPQTPEEILAEIINPSIKKE